MDEDIEVLDSSESIKKEKRKLSSIIVLVLFLISILASGFLIYNILLLDGIENLIRYLVIGVLGLIDLFSLVKTRNIWKNKPPKKKKKNKKYVLKRIFILVLIKKG